MQYSKTEKVFATVCATVQSHINLNIRYPKCIQFIYRYFYFKYLRIQWKLKYAYISLWWFRRYKPKVKSRSRRVSLALVRLSKKDIRCKLRMIELTNTISYFFVCSRIHMPVSSSRSVRLVKCSMYTK